MKSRSFKLGLFCIGIMLLASCSKKHGTADIGYDESGASTHGLGQFTQFAGQAPGESYTTKAPHNQRYLFSYDDSAFASKYKPSLMAQAEYLRSHPGARVLLAGHTDERGSREYNVALGERRANTVADLLRMWGVNRHQLRMVSYGKERPLYTGHDDEAHKMNRRVELTYEATR